MPPFMTRRICKVTAAELYDILLRDNMFMHQFSDETRSAIEGSDEGCVLFLVQAGSPSLKEAAADGTVATIPNDIRVFGWRGRSCARALVAKEQRLHWMVLLGRHPDEARKEYAIESELCAERRRKQQADAQALRDATVATKA
eukprot:UC1_evm1s1337